MLKNNFILGEKITGKITLFIFLKLDEGSTMTMS